MWGKSNTINKSSSCADVGRKVGIVLCPGRAGNRNFWLKAVFVRFCRTGWRIATPLKCNLYSKDLNEITQIFVLGEN